MNNTKGQNRIITKKFIITILLIVSFAMTSSTFAYWAGAVEGTSGSTTLDFVVGSPIYDNQEFVLDSEINSYKYQIDLEYLLENPNTNIDEVVFGIMWNDDSLPEELKEKLLNGEVTVEYNLLLMRNGKEANQNQYNRYGTLINIEVDDDNPESLTYNGSPSTFRFDVTLNEENKKNDYKNLAKFEAYVVVTFEVDYDE